MKRSSASTATVGSSCGHTMWRKRCVGVAPSSRPASSSASGTACRRAVRKRKANGKERHISKAITVSSAVGRGIPSTVEVRWLRKATGSSHPSRPVPHWLTMPNCGLSITPHTKVAATTGAT